MGLVHLLCMLTSRDKVEKIVWESIHKTSAYVKAEAVGQRTRFNVT